MSSSSWNSPFVSGSMLGFLFSMIEVGTCAIHDDFQYPFRYLTLDFLSKKNPYSHFFFLYHLYSYVLHLLHSLLIYFPNHRTKIWSMISIFVWANIRHFWEMVYTYWLNPKATFYIDGGCSFFMCALSKSNKKINLA